MLFPLLACIGIVGNQDVSSQAISSLPPEVLMKKMSSVVQRQCIRCHSGERGAVFSLRTGRNLVRYARGMAGEALAQRMPPGCSQGGVTSFLPDSPFTATDVAILWEWSNRVEKSSMEPEKLSTIPLTVPQVIAATFQSSLKLSIPAEGDDGLYRSRFQLRIPDQYRNRPVTGFWVTSDCPSRLARASVRLGEIILGWSFGNVPWRGDHEGPRLPGSITGELTALPEGEAHEVRVTLNFRLEQPRTDSKAVWRNLHQAITASGRTELTVTSPTKIYGFHPNFGTQLESWEATFAVNGSPRQRFAAQPAAVGRSIGTYYLSNPILLPAGSRLGFVVQFRRNHHVFVSADWLATQ